MSQNELFTLVTGAKTDVGRQREINEDNMIARPDYGLWCVADGMGGHAAGDFASGRIVEELASIGVPASIEDLQVRFMERITRANDAILTHARQLDSGTIGATVVSLLVQGSDYACIWSGDSRVYLMRAGQLVQQSRDHTEVRALLDSGSITEEEAANWPRKNVITRAIGVTELPQCDMVTGQLQEGDYFLLCSDGLTEHFEDPDIAAAMAARGEPQALCDYLIAETLERGARDNVTVIAMRCGPPPAVDENMSIDDLMDGQI